MNTQLEIILTRRRKNEMVAFINEHPEYFDEAINIAISQQKHFSWRAAWLISGTLKKDDPRVKPYIPKILDIILESKDGHQRELLKILLKMNLSEDQQSMLFDISANLWEQIRKKPSVRHFAFSCMVKVAENYPELKNEILLLAQPHYINPLSPGIKQSILKSLKKLEN